MKRAMVVLIAVACASLALLVVFGAGLSSSQSHSRQVLRQQAHDRATLAASLIDSAFSTTASSGTTSAEGYAAGPVSTATLDAHVGADYYLAVLDADGSVIAGSTGFSPQARAELAAAPAVTGVSRRGGSFALSDVMAYGTTTLIDIAVPFTTPQGNRVLVTGFSPSVIEGFVTPELRTIPGASGATNTLVDSHDVVLATTNGSLTAGRSLSPSGEHALRAGSGTLNGTYFATAPLVGTSWRIVLAAPSSSFFAPVSGSHELLPWLLLAAFGLVAVAVLVLGYRLARSADRLRRVNVRLADVNGELTEANGALHRRAAELARSNEELQQFASIASHDLQEPLRKIRTYTQQLEVTEADQLSEKGREYVQRANAAGARMQTLIEDLLSYARVGTRGRPFAPTDLAEVVATVVDDLALQLEESGATLTVGTLPTIVADEPQMRQMVQNLLSNAVKFRREGVPVEIEIGAVTSADRVEMIVRDNGIGFDPRYGQRIFRVFERLHGRSAYPGTGIGLALCRKIAERHGGTVVAESSEGAGATFIVTLPLDPPDSIIDIRPGDEPLPGFDSTPDKAPAGV